MISLKNIEEIQNWKKNIVLIFKAVKCHAWEMVFWCGTCGLAKRGAQGGDVWTGKAWKIALTMGWSGFWKDARKVLPVSHLDLDDSPLTLKTRDKYLSVIWLQLPVVGALLWLRGIVSVSNLSANKRQRNGYFLSARSIFIDLQELLYLFVCLGLLAPFLSRAPNHSLIPKVLPFRVDYIILL